MTLLIISFVMILITILVATIMDIQLKDKQPNSKFFCGFMAVFGTIGVILFVFSVLSSGIINK